MSSLTPPRYTVPSPSRPSLLLIVLTSMLWWATAIQYRVDLLVSSVTATEVVLIAIAIIAVMYQAVVNKRLALTSHSLWWVLCGLILVALIVRIWATNRNAGLSDVRNWLIPVMTTGILLGTISRGWRRITLMLVAAVVMFSVFGLIQVRLDGFRPFVIGEAVYKTGFALGDDGLTLTSSSYAVGLFSHPNRFAQYVFVGLCVLQGWLAESRRWWFLKILLSLVVIAALYFTYAKASLLSMIFVLMLFWLSHFIRNTRALLATIFTGTGVGVVFATALLQLQISETFTETLLWRAALWASAIRVFAAHPLTLLVGNGDELLLPFLPPSISEPHNVYLYLTLCYGVAGSVVMLLFIGFMLYDGMRNHARGLMHAQPLLAGLWFGLLSFFLVGLVESNLQEIEMRTAMAVVLMCYLGLARETRIDQGE